MSKRYIIVEDDNDKYTFEAIIRNMKIGENIEVESAENEDNIEWIPKSAENNIEKPTGLKESFESLLREIIKGRCEKIGIIWDLDNLSKKERISQFNTAIELAVAAYRAENSDIVISFPKKIVETNKFYDLDVDGIVVKIACHFIHFQGKGELEDLLKAIKAKPSPIADCVDEHLPKCLEQHQKNALKDKAVSYTHLTLPTR